jgi:hypothetical protein
VKLPEEQLRARLKAAAKRAILEFDCAQDRYWLSPTEKHGPGEMKFLALCLEAYREAQAEAREKK